MHILVLTILMQWKHCWTERQYDHLHVSLQKRLMKPHEISDIPEFSYQTCSTNISCPVHIYIYIYHFPSYYMKMCLASVTADWTLNCSPVTWKVNRPHVSLSFCDTNAKKKRKMLWIIIIMQRAQQRENVCPV